MCGDKGDGAPTLFGANAHASKIDFRHFSNFIIDGPEEPVYKPEDTSMGNGSMHGLGN
jgi:hypothetical protein